jgi:hypothetical protein
MSNAAANWYPDPSNPGQLRWWDGLQWSAQTRPVFAPPSGPPLIPAMGTPDPYLSAPTTPLPAERKVAASTQLLRLNKIGFVGAVLGIASLIIDPFCAVSIAAVVLCGVGLGVDGKLRSAGNTRTGLGWVIAGLVIGVVATLKYLLTYLAQFASLR